jgi:hypothetical protein
VFLGIERPVRFGGCPFCCPSQSRCADVLSQKKVRQMPCHPEGSRRICGCFSSPIVARHGLQPFRQLPLDH